MALRIYLCEDSAPLCERLRELFAAAGAEVVGVADTLDDALRDLAATPVDVLVTDVHLREGNGFELLRRLRDTPQPSGQWRVVLTHYSSSYYRDAATRFGATHFFDKQWDIGEMLDTIAGHPSRLDLPASGHPNGDRSETDFPPPRDARRADGAQG